jgi:hypothetical protein
MMIIAAEQIYKEKKLLVLKLFLDKEKFLFSVILLEN